MKKLTRNDINKENMVALSYCQCQSVLNMFAYDYKIGYNAGVYGWNYDLYKIGGCSIVTGYHIPYAQYSNEELKNKLVALENEIRNGQYNYEKYEEYKERFLKIFE